MIQVFKKCWPYCFCADGKILLTGQESAETELSSGSWRHNPRKFRNLTKMLITNMRWTNKSEEPKDDDDRTDNRTEDAFVVKTQEHETLVFDKNNFKVLY